ncbi:MAG: glycoside hydrolase family 3 C-terminal domain-containing protein, partial [Acidimicrobiales bacterium]
LSAGLGVEMPYRMVRAQHLLRALEAGDVSWDQVDSAVARLVATILRFDEVLGATQPDASVIDCPEHRELAREAAARSVVLLRNEPVDGTPVLPIDAGTARSIAVFGSLADTVNLGDAGSSDVWALECHTVLDGLGAELGADRVTYDPSGDLAQAARIAAPAEVAIVVTGFTYLDEGEFIGDTNEDLVSLFPGPDDPELVERFKAELEAFPTTWSTVKPSHVSSRPAAVAFKSGGDRKSLRLTPESVELIRAVSAANPRTVVVLQAGSAVITTDWEDEVGAIVQAWYGGCEAGPGVADVLFGRVNPSARLPFTVPADESHLPFFDPQAREITYDRWHGWWHFRRTGHRPAFPFGFGLSYTTFELGPVEVSREGEMIRIDGSVANTGTLDGADVVQVYAELPDPDSPPRLVAFARLEVEAAGRRKFALRIPVDRLATRDSRTHRWVGPQGVHRLFVGRHADDPLAQTVTVELTGPEITKM